ncbi:MAG: DEAD/DEAH box helicase [Oscillospiraceae bacterium]|nr:DEAD/DEAH box helicase [Oscillospiraceae bacterium]
MDMYEQFAPYIQDYIYRQGWSGLRPVQTAAAEVLFGSDDHLLLSTGTASGKTEAAFLPALTLLHRKPAQSVGILYVSPLKALINDQFARLTGLLAAGGLPVTKWHGDAPAGAKTRLLQSKTANDEGPRGVLQITPESLESLLMHKSAACKRLFADLRFVIVDEVHYFMSNERGLQLQCLLARLERLCGCNPRRIGLSATLGNPEAAMDWLCAGTHRRCRHPEVPDQKRRLLLWMRYFCFGEEGMRSLLYEQTLGKKTIIFTIERVAAELTIAHLKRIAAKAKSPDVYRVHHGSINAALREETEREMKRSETPVVTAATVTLELGLDIGDLDRVIQMGLAPLSVSSFVQRIGRCGRLGQQAELLFVLQSELEPTPDDPLSHLDWELIKAIAIVQLYLEERWVEPIAPQWQPFGLLYHQTMCTLAALGEVSPARLAQNMLTLPAFRAISQEDFKLLLRHLIDRGHIMRGDAGGLMVGYNAEPIVTSYEFLSVFTAPDEFQVRHKNETIGTVTEATLPGERLVLTGRCWEVTACDEQKKIINVKPSKRTAETKWKSFTRGKMHKHLVRRMHRVLAEDTDYPYLSPETRNSLAKMRGIARTLGLATRSIVPLPPNSCILAPQLGTPALQTLQLALQGQGIRASMIPGGFTPMLLHCESCTEPMLRRALRALRTEGINLALLDFDPLKLRPRQKFDDFLPEELLRREIIAECLDVDGAMQFAADCPP